MSWTFHLQKINQAFERIALWYTEFMHRTELCFRALNERILRLEERQVTQGPGDEQIERVLRKILAERFSNPSIQQSHNAQGPRGDDYFVEKRGNHASPGPIPIDPAMLNVDPEAVPSHAYTDTFQMLEQRLARFPHMDSSSSQEDEDEDTKMNLSLQTPKSMEGV